MEGGVGEEGSKFRPLLHTQAGMNASMNECMNASMNECMNACMHACLNAAMNACMYACMNAGIHAAINAAINACMNVYMNASMNVYVQVLMHVCMYEECDMSVEEDLQTAPPAASAHPLSRSTSAILRVAAQEHSRGTAHSPSPH